MSLKKSILLLTIILIIDQVSKVYIKLNFPLTLYGQAALVDWGWFKILFVENKGMAWGAKINDFIPFISERTGKLMLTSFRIFAVPIIFYWLYDSIKKSESKLLTLSITLILAGAIGNLIDSVFYGYLFTESYLNIAILSPGNDDEKIMNIIKESLSKSLNESFSVTDNLSIPLREARENFEKEYLVSQIKKFGGNISKTAKFVGMERSALHRKLKLLGVKDLN